MENNELKQLGKTAGSEDKMQNLAPVQIAESSQNVQKRKVNFNVILLVVYLIFAVAIIFYQRYSAAKVSEKAEAVIARQSMLDKQMSEEQQQQQFTPDTSGSAFDMAQPAAAAEGASSTDMFMQSVKQERANQGMDGNIEKQPVLDYGAEVKDYQAKVRSEEQVQAAAPQQNIQQMQAVAARQNIQQMQALPQNQAQPSAGQQAAQPTKINKLQTTKGIFK
jgi:hypothetical protein